MKNILVCVYDRKAAYYAAPVLFRNEEEAKRAFSMAIAKDPMLSQFPEDYDIVKVADMDVETGDVVPSKFLLCRVADLIASIKSQEVSGQNPGTFSLSTSASEVDQSTSEEVASEGQKGYLQFGGYKK